MRKSFFKFYAFYFCFLFYYDKIKLQKIFIKMFIIYFTFL